MIPKQKAETEFARLNEVAKDEKKTKMEIEYLVIKKKISKTLLLKYIIIVITLILLKEID